MMHIIKAQVSFSLFHQSNKKNTKGAFEILLNMLFY